MHACELTIADSTHSLMVWVIDTSEPMNSYELLWLVTEAWVVPPVGREGDRMVYILWRQQHRLHLIARAHLAEAWDAIPRLPGSLVPTGML